LALFTPLLLGNILVAHQNYLIVLQCPSDRHAMVMAQMRNPAEA
jgi:hypothetical protein